MLWAIEVDKCRRSKLADLPGLAECHRLAFPGSLSTAQGSAFSRKMLEWYIEADRGVMFHVEEQGRIIGYCGGIIIRVPGLPGAVTSITQYAFWHFVRAYLRRPWLIFHPENLKRREYIIRNILIRAGLVRAGNTAAVKATDTQVERHRPCWGLVVIGIEPTFQGNGLGGEMGGWRCDARAKPCSCEKN